LQALQGWAIQQEQEARNYETTATWKAEEPAVQEVETVAVELTVWEEAEMVAWELTAWEVVERTVVEPIATQGDAKVVVLVRMESARKQLLAASFLPVSHRFCK
jgi:hypothetical protein